MTPGRHILIVERAENAMAALEDDLRRAGYEDVSRCPGERAVRDVARLQPALVLIEFGEGEISSAELCRAVKRCIEPGFVPVAVLTGEAPTSVVCGFEVGADDCIHWPYDSGEMLARVHNMLHIKALHDELRRVNEQLTELSTRDGLTGLYNRRYLFEQLAVELERAVRYQQPLSCIMVDMDQFKPVNDEFGHLVGDEVFRRMADIFISVSRRSDIVARYGGDEICTLLPASSLEAAEKLAHRLCDTIGATPFDVGDHNIRITISAGLACMDPRNPFTSDELVRRADVALYASKNVGGNHVTVWKPDLAEPQAGLYRRKPR